MAWGSSPGCNHVVNGESKCFKRWNDNDNPKEALKCCMSYREGDISQFNVPIIVLPYSLYDIEFTSITLEETEKTYQKIQNAFLGHSMISLASSTF